MTSGEVDQLAPLTPSVGRVQTGGYRHGIDISDNRQNPCRNDKSFNDCCTLDSLFDILSP